MNVAVRSVVLLSLCAACTHTAPSSARTAAPPPSSAASARLDLEQFEPEIRAFEASDRAAMPAPNGIVFVGSSSIRRWTSLAADFPGLPVLNRGFGGSTFPEANHYVSRLVLADYHEFVRLVRGALPSARIVVVGIKPSPSRWQLADQQREANRLLREAVAMDTLQSYVDVFAPMLGAGGRPEPSLFVSDSLHMTPAGYAIWRAQIAPQLR
jgi:hypothetical protein